MSTVIKNKAGQSTTENTEKKFNYSWIGIYLMLMAIVIIYLIFKLWPNFITDDKDIKAVDKFYYLFGNQYSINDETRWLLIVILTGALGSYIHATTSFVTFVGNRSLVKSWTWWYILRPFVGSSLSLIFYFVIRGGLLSAGTDASNVSIFGIAAISGMVGMFSKNATDKLKEVFDNLFKTEKGQGDDARADKLEAAIPVKDKMIPLSLIKTYTIPAGKSAGEIPLLALNDLLQGAITRLPVLDDKSVVKYIIHQSMLSKFYADQSLNADAKDTAELDKLTLQDFLNYPMMNELVTESVAFIKTDATLEEAKEKMEAVTNCQDVFVTENGKPSEPIVGWLTNVDIARHLNG